MPSDKRPFRIVADPATNGKLEKLNDLNNELQMDLLNGLQMEFQQINNSIKMEATNNLTLILFIGLCFYNMGNMMSLQLQHYSLYPLIEPDNFVKYIQGNNKSAFLPAILPAIVSLALSIKLIFSTTATVPDWYPFLGLAMNLVVLASTIIWQARIQGKLAQTGFDASKIKTLITTNWIRTIAYSVQGISSLWLLSKLLL